MASIVLANSFFDWSTPLRKTDRAKLKHLKEELSGLLINSWQITTVCWYNINPSTVINFPQITHQPETVQQSVRL